MNKFKVGDRVRWIDNELYAAGPKVGDVGTVTRTYHEALGEPCVDVTFDRPTGSDIGSGWYEHRFELVGPSTHPVASEKDLIGIADLLSSLNNWQEYVEGKLGVKPVEVFNETSVVLGVIVFTDEGYMFAPGGTVETDG